jgi:hypothetical protein
MLFIVTFYSIGLDGVSLGSMDVKFGVFSVHADDHIAAMCREEMFLPNLVI